MSESSRGLLHLTILAGLSPERSHSSALRCEQGQLPIPGTTACKKIFEFKTRINSIIWCLSIFFFIIAPPWRLLRHFYILICPLHQNTTEILFIYLPFLFLGFMHIKSKILLPHNG